MTNFHEWLFSQPEFDTPEKRANVKQICLGEEGRSFLEPLSSWAERNQFARYKEVDEISFPDFVNLERLALWSDGVGGSRPLIIKKLDLSWNPKLKHLKLLSGCLPLYLDVGKSPNLNKIIFDYWCNPDSGGEKVLDLRNNPLKNKPNLICLELVLKSWGRKNMLDNNDNGLFIKDKICSHIFEEWEKEIKELVIKKESLEKVCVKSIEWQKNKLQSKLPISIKQKVQQEEKTCSRLDKFLTEVKQLTQLQKNLPVESREDLLANNRQKIARIKQKLSSNFTEQEIQEVQKLQEELADSELEARMEARILVPGRSNI